MTGLDASVSRVLSTLADGDLSSDAVVESLLSETHTRRSLSLTDLSPDQQAGLVSARATTLIPSVESLSERIASARRERRPLTVKFGIDPTSSDVHLGHAVPMLVLSRFQRMGHQIVFIVGDITARIGDPSGRSDERPPLGAAEIAGNLSTYQEQVGPFFDFSQAKFQRNSEWLAGITLPDFVDILAGIPASMSLQREDFRERLAHGHGLTMAEFVYSVVMAIDSVKVRADVELGGVDQLLNMQMGRKVMSSMGLEPQGVVAMPLIEGTDGSGSKMSKSKGNYIALNASPQDVFGKIMSVPDRMITAYLSALTEWTDAEIETVSGRLEAQTLHPMDLKKILAGEVVAALRGVAEAQSARRGFAAQFSSRSFEDLSSIPTVELARCREETLGVVLTEHLGFAPSLGAARRLARQNGLRLVFQEGAEQEHALLDDQSIGLTLGSLVHEAMGSSGREVAGLYLKAGRKLARIQR